MALLNKFVLALVAVFAVLAGSPNVVAKTPVEAFARMPLFGGPFAELGSRLISISPTGNYVAAKFDNKGEEAFIVFKIDGNKVVPTMATKTDGAEVLWTKWGSSERVLVSVGKSSFRFATPTYDTRLFAMNYDGTKRRDVVKAAPAYFDLQFQDQVIDFLPDDPDYIIMVYNEDNARRPRANKVNIHTGNGRTIQSGRNDISGWMTDIEGEVRLGYGRDASGTVRYIARAAGSESWREVYSSKVGDGKRFGVYGFSDNPNKIYVLSNHAGGTSKLFKFDIVTGQFGAQLHGHPQVDVSRVWINRKTGKLRRASIQLDGHQHKWFDPRAKMDLKRAAEAFPRKAISVMDATPDDKKWILHVGADNDAGQYVIFDRSRGHLASLGPNFPELKGVKLSKRIAFSYAARDGLTIPGFLWLPPNVGSIEKAKSLPLVVNPHGGPASREYRTFDPFVQMMTNRGIAVLQMDFRGSAGYGNAFEDAGAGEWGGKMQDDITDGAQHLIDRGIADPNRICVFGISYGAYATMMGAVKTPNLFKCAVAVNGVYDLKEMMATQRYYINWGGFAYWESVIGDFNDTTFLKSISPAERADEIRIPVLLAANRDDRVVRSSQSDAMASAMRSANVDYDYLKMDDGGHGLRTSESRLEFMKALDAFLEEHLNP